MGRSLKIRNELQIRLRKILSERDYPVFEVKYELMGSDGKMPSWLTISKALKSIGGSAYRDIDNTWNWTIRRLTEAERYVSDGLRLLLKDKEKKASDCIKMFSEVIPARKVKLLAKRIPVMRRVSNGIVLWTLMGTPNEVAKRVEDRRVGSEAQKERARERKARREEVKRKSEPLVYSNELAQGLATRLRKGDWLAKHLRTAFPAPKYRASDIREALEAIGAKMYKARQGWMWSLAPPVKKKKKKSTIVVKADY